MNKFTFDFYNRNYTQRITITATSAAFSSGKLVTVGDDGALAEVVNTTNIATLDNLFLLAEDIPVGGIYMVGYPIREDDWIAGVYLGKDITVGVGLDVAVHGGYIIPAEDLGSGGAVGLEIVKIADLVSYGSVAVSINTASATSLTAGTRVAIDSNSAIAASNTGKYILAANYAAGASTASLKTYRAPVVVKLI